MNLLRNLVLASSLFITAPAIASSTHDVMVSHVRCPPGKEGGNIPVYFKSKTNNIDDVLLSASSPDAKSVELHTGTSKMMKMSKMEANTESDSKHKWGHLMLIGLTKDLNKGDTFPVTLHFQIAGDVTETVKVW